MTDFALKKGDRIRLLDMPDDPCPIPPGTTGTVTHVGQVWPHSRGDTRQIYVKWDIPRSLILLHGHDRYEILEPAPEASFPWLEPEAREAFKELPEIHGPTDRDFP